MPTQLEVAQADSNRLNEFEQYMLHNAHDWMLVNKTDQLLSYQKTIPAQKASCLILGLLLILGVIPGLLYLYFGHKSAKQFQLSVTLDANNNLVASGDPEGLSVYSKFLQSLNKQLTETPTVV